MEIGLVQVIGDSRAVAVALTPYVGPALALWGGPKLIKMGYRIIRGDWGWAGPARWVRAKDRHGRYRDKLV